MNHFRFGKHRWIPLLAIAWSWLVTVTPAHAQQLYRYQDAQGNPVISSSLSNAAIQNGYSVLDSSGRVLKKVAPAPTREELDRKARQQAQQSTSQKAAERQHKADQVLLRTYSGPDDAVRALHRKMRELNSVISLKEGNVSVLEDQLQNQQAKAANAERAGKTVSHGVMKKMQSLQHQINGAQKEIADQRQDIQKIKQTYIKKIKRLEQLTGKKRTLPINLPKQKDENAGQ